MTWFIEDSDKRGHYTMGGIVKTVQGSYSMKCSGNNKKKCCVPEAGAKNGQHPFIKDFFRGKKAGGAQAVAKRLKMCLSGNLLKILL